ncbi:MAG: PQQ-binding-like beta-propeller repeat protein [candidate division WOR-3 bacterium]
MFSKNKRMGILLIFGLILLSLPNCGKNKPPTVPYLTGPTTLGLNAEGEFKAQSTDPNNDEIRYLFDWVDKLETTDYYPSGDTAKKLHSWSTPGTYQVKVQAQDKKGNLSGWSSPLTVSVVTNNKPNKPTVSGPSSGLKDTTYNFSVTPTDPDGDSVRVLFFWGDGKVDTSSWVASGTSVERGHAYSDTGIFTIKALVQDIKFALSDTSDPKIFTVLFGYPPGEILWTFIGGDEFVSSPALVIEGGIPVIYIGCKDGKVYKLNGKTGAKMAEFSSPVSGDEFNSSPAIATDGTVYITSEEGYLFALTSNLTLKWQWPAGGRGMPFTSPALTGDGKIIIGNENGNLYCVKDNGSSAESLWTFSARGPIFSSPAIDAQGNIYFAELTDSGYLYKLNSSGQLLWEKMTGGEVYASPALDAQGNVFLSSTSGKVFAFDGNGNDLTGWPVVAPDTAEVHSSVVFEPSANLVILGHERGILLYRPNGTLQDHILVIPEEVSSTPTVAQDSIVYYLTSEGWFVGYNYLGRTSLFTKYLGSRFSKKLQEDIYSSPTIAPDGTIYVAFEERVYALYGKKPLANSPWPKFRQGLKNTGRAGGGKI